MSKHYPVEQRERAALEVATGKVTDACHPRHTHAEFLAFLKQVAKAYPRVPASPPRPAKR